MSKLARKLDRDLEVLRQCGRLVAACVELGKAMASESTAKPAVAVALENASLRLLAFACYQQAGRAGAPEAWLDTLLAASEGRPFSLSGLEQYDPKPFQVPVEGVIE